MKTLKLLNVTVALASILFAGTAVTQDAKTLNELLDMIERARLSLKQRRLGNEKQILFEINGDSLNS